MKIAKPHLMRAISLRLVSSVSLGACALTVTLALPASAVPADQKSPEDFGTPTAEQLSESVQVWNPDSSVVQWHPRGSIHKIQIGESIEPLVQEQDDASKTVITLTSDVLFEFGSATIPKNAAKAVTESLENVPKNSDVKVSGHTDAVGSAGSNKKLSQQRARAVADVITDARPDLKVTAKGYGETRPVAPNMKNGKDNPAGRAKNRRVEVRYSK